jgi:hypothetical protein
MTLGDQRYRNRLRIKHPLFKGKLVPWVGDEVRYFFRKGHFAMNELFLGFESRISSQLSINLYYDYRLIKSPLDGWIKTPVVQSEIAYKF